MDVQRSPRTLKQAKEQGWREIMPEDYGGERLDLKGHTLVRGASKAVSKTEWRRRGFKVMAAETPHATLRQQVRGRVTVTYAVYRQDQVTPRNRRSAPTPAQASPPTPDNIGAALYEVNKAAKRRRDAAHGAYEDGNFAHARKSKVAKETYYRLKDRVIRKALQGGGAQLVGFHVSQREVVDDRRRWRDDEDDWDDEDGGEPEATYHTVKDYFAVYRIATYTFHCPVNSLPEGVDATDLGAWLSQAARCGTKMRLRDAEATLHAYLAPEVTLLPDVEQIDTGESCASMERRQADGIIGMEGETENENTEGSKERQEADHLR